MPINSNQDQQTKLLEIVNISTKDIEKCIGVIGFGDMGRLYVEAFLRAGYTNIHICDIPERFNNLAEWATGKAVTAHRDGTSVVRICDFVLFSVQAALINKVVGMHGPAMKQGSIACGQTSVKDPEIKAFDKYLPPDVQVVTCHSLHGPSISPKGQPLVVMRHRCSDDAKFEFVVRLLSSLQSRIVYLTPDEHDHITADTQAITHLAFLSMGTAWKTQNCFPWEVPQYTGGIEHAKILMTLRIYSSKWHVYSGLAFLNPHALTQVAQFSKSVSVLFKLMIQEKEAEFRSRIYKAREFVFGDFEQKPILLDDALLDEYSLSSVPITERKPNSHLSLLAMVDCWHELGIRPFDHLICQTPPFRLLLGISEYLFRDKVLLESAIEAALFSKDIRGDDCEFYTCAKGWVDCIQDKNEAGYASKFLETRDFFQDRIDESRKVSDRMLMRLASATNNN